MKKPTCRNHILMKQWRDECNCWQYRCIQCNEWMPNQEIQKQMIVPENDDSPYAAIRG